MHQQHHQTVYYLTAPSSKPCSTYPPLDLLSEGASTTGLAGQQSAALDMLLTLVAFVEQLAAEETGMTLDYRQGFLVRAHCDRVVQVHTYDITWYNALT